MNVLYYDYSLLNLCLLYRKGREFLSVHTVALSVFLQPVVMVLKGTVAGDGVLDHIIVSMI